jgi:hypothetical protein
MIVILYSNSYDRKDLTLVDSYNSFLSDKIKPHFLAITYVCTCSEEIFKEFKYAGVTIKIPSLLW